MEKSHQIGLLRFQVDALSKPIKEAEATLDALKEKKYNLLSEIAHLSGWKRGAVIVNRNGEKGVIVNVCSPYQLFDNSYEIDWRAFKKDGALGKMHRHDLNGAKLTGETYEGKI